MSSCKDKTQLFTEEVWRNKNFQIFEEMIHRDFEYHDPIMTTVTTKEEYKAFITGIQTRSPDMKYDMLDIIAEGNKVVVLYSFSGTPVTDPTGAPLNGIKVEHKGVAIYYYENDKIVKIWDVWDMYSVLKQLGKIP
jgi:steroid delta-isomerase-like uncharacterized protein